MKLIYITSYAFPSNRAEPYYLKSMAEAFTQRMGKNFLLIIRGTIPVELKKVNAESLMMPRHARVVFCFFWFPAIVMKRRWYGSETVFMSNDPYLLSIFIFWRKAFRFKYSICSDWHQLFEDWKDKFVAKNSDYLISTTKRLKEFLVSKCTVSPEKILVAYGGINPTLFERASKIEKREIRKTLGLPTNTFLVGYVGGFKSAGLEKGLATMIRSLSHLTENIGMVFVGGSKDYDGEYPVMAKELGVENRCFFVGKQPFERVVEYELAMDVLVIPYPDKPHFRNYGFPLKVWEYMAAGRPIVYSDLKIIGEVLEGRGTPFVPDDVISFAEAITSVYEGSGAAGIIAEKNPTIVQEYTWEARVAHIVTFIQTSTYGKR